MIVPYFPMHQWLHRTIFPWFTPVDVQMDQELHSGEERIAHGMVRTYQPISRSISISFPRIPITVHEENIYTISKFYRSIHFSFLWILRNKFSLISSKFESWRKLGPARLETLNTRSRKKSYWRKRSSRGERSISWTSYWSSRSSSRKRNDSKSN